MPAQAAAEFVAIAARPATALTEMRRLLGVLRSESSPAEPAPQPGLADLDALVDAARAGRAAGDPGRRAGRRGPACPRRSGSPRTGSCRKLSPTPPGTHAGAAVRVTVDAPTALVEVHRRRPGGPDRPTGGGAPGTG